MAGSALTLSEARATLADAAARSSALIASLPDDNRRIKNSEWTVCEAAAHMAIGLRGFTDAAGGAPELWSSMIPDTAHFPDRLGGLNRVAIAAEPRRDVRQAAQAITDGAAAFLAATSGMPPGQKIPTPWYGDHASHTVLSATCLLAGEQLVHGYDIAKTVGQKWPVTADQAWVVLGGLWTMMPIAAKPEAIRSLEATYELHIVGRDRVRVQIANGSVVINPPDPTRVDCHIAGSPKGFLLVAYRRVSQYRLIATGRMMAWGRKPWIAFRLVNLFFQP
jgi:uncharacterized protein (TIGR03083 family)